MYLSARRGRKISKIVAAVVTLVLIVGYFISPCQIIKIDIRGINVSINLAFTPVYSTMPVSGMAYVGSTRVPYLLLLDNISPLFCLGSLNSNAKRCLGSPPIF